jgi:hypothetical protein
MAGLIPIGRIVDPSRDVFPSTGAHLDVRVIPQFGANKGKKIDPRSAKGLLQNILVGKDKRPLVQQQGQDWKWNLPVTSEFGPRKAPTAGASTFHQGIDVGIPVGTELTYKGYGTYRPDHGFGSLMTADAQGNPYEIRLLHTEPGKAASVGSSVVPAAPQLPGATPAQTNERNTEQLMTSLIGEQPSLKDMLLAGALQKAMQRKQETMNQFMQPIQSAVITPQQAMELFS